MPSSKILLVAVTVSVISALVVPAAAISLDDDSLGAVQFEPTSQYAAIEDGKLTLNFDRLNADATTTVDAVFEVTAANDTVRQFWIGHDLAGVTFYADGDRGSELDASDPAPLTNGETITVGMSIDTREAPTGTETVSMVIAKAEKADEGGLPGHPTPGEPADRPPVNVSDASIVDAEVAVGETVAVTATVTNPHDETVAGAVDLGVDDRVVADKEIELAPNESRTVRFEWTPAEAGTRSVTVVGEPVGTVVVSESARLTLGSYDLASPLTAAVAPPATLGLLFLGSAARGRRR